jgi:hypothetical protein
MTTQRVYRPGEKAPVSGEYEIIGPRGGDTGKERTSIQGERLPPDAEARARVPGPSSRAQRGR